MHLSRTPIGSPFEQCITHNTLSPSLSLSLSLAPSLHTYLRLSLSPALCLRVFVCLFVHRVDLIKSDDHEDDDDDDDDAVDDDDD